jgi:hypothetical protein
VASSTGFGLSILLHGVWHGDDERSELGAGLAAKSMDRNRSKGSMAKEHIDSLKSLRDHLVEDRRNMVASIMGEMAMTSESAGEFCGLQQFIDAVEMAISHEHSLERPGGPAWTPQRPKGPGR